MVVLMLLVTVAQKNPSSDEVVPLCSVAFVHDDVDPVSVVMAAVIAEAL
jgi:hypothetical protein